MDETTEREIVLEDMAARQAIGSDLGRNLFVEAGAGTGKTTALVGRIVSLVTDVDHPVDLSEIAAITFTEAAAAELRERVRSEFETLLRTARESGDSDLAQRCVGALDQADIAAISTLHAFAQRLLAEFPIEAGLPPRIETLDEVASQLEFEDRWASFLDRLYEDAEIEEFIVRASLLNVELNGDAFRNIAREFDANWDRLQDIDFRMNKVRPIDWFGLNEAIVQVRGLGSDCADESDKLLEYINRSTSTFDRFERASGDRERLKLLPLLTGFKSKVGKKANWVDVEAARETVAAVGAVASEIHEAVSEACLTEIAARIAQFTLASARERATQGRLEFHDLLVLANQLLASSPEALRVLSQRYQRILLDEFQDTDPLQISIALQLAAAHSIDDDPEVGWRSLRAGDGRMFMVGDPKQSIYRFRRADIDLFLEAQNRFGEGEVKLQQNFRTVPPILRALNAMFGGLMAPGQANQAPYTPLLAVRDASGADHRPVVFGDAHDGKAGEVRSAEAGDVAEIVLATQSNPDDWPVFDNDTGTWRAPKLSDIAILLPTRTSLPQLTEELSRRSIPYRADTGTLVYETQEVRDLLNALAAVDDPTDEIALVAALRSPLYGCSDDDLFRWKRAGGSFDLRASISDELKSSPVCEGIEHLRSLEETKWWQEPSALLVRLIDERFAMALAVGADRARDTWRRLRYVVDQARAFAESGSGDLRIYLRWTRLQGADGSKAHEPMLSEADDDAVQIMTVHGSKGLEFPIAIVSGLTTLANRKPTVKGQVMWGGRTEMPQVKASASVRTFQFDAAKELEEQMDAPERERLLYVALTRARDHLAMSGYHSLYKSGKRKASHGATIAEFATGDNNSLIRTFDSPEVPSSGLVPTSAPSIEFGAPQTVAELARGSEVLRPSVLSVTALVSAQMGNRQQLATRPPFEPEPVRERDAIPHSPSPDRDTARRVGDAVHSVMQLIDLERPEDELIQRLSSSQAARFAVPGADGQIMRTVQRLLHLPIIEACRSSRHWQELFVAGPLAGRTVEGYIDLLVETDAGLVVVDYKTTSVKIPKTVTASYALQVATYAELLEVTTGKTVAASQVLFASQDDAVAIDVRDLDERRESLRVNEF